MRVKVILIDGTRHDLENCQEVFVDSYNPKFLNVTSGNVTYAFNLNMIKYVQNIEEEENNG
jgi:hypothetical protein